MGARIILCIVLSGLLSVYLPADVSIVVTAPKLKEGMASLESMIAAETAVAAQEISLLVEALADKPRFLEGFSAAASALGLIPGASPLREQWLLGVGSTAALVSEIPFADIGAALAAFNEESDLGLGFSAQPLLVQVGIPVSGLIPGLLPGLGTTLAFGYINHRPDDLLLRSITMAALVAYEIVPKAAELLPAWLSWSGLRVGLGYTWNNCSVAMQVQPGPVVQTILLDPDGPGPLAPLTAVLTMEPDIMVGIVSTVQQVRVQLSSALDMFGTLRMNAGLGLSLQWGGSAVSLAMDQPVSVEGYLSSLISEDGRIVISGTVAGLPYRSGSVYFLVAPAFLVGNFRVSVPVAWHLPFGLSAGLMLELVL